DEDRRALGEDLSERLAALAPDDDVVPIGSLAPHLVLVEIRLGGGETDVEDRLPALRVAKLGVGPQVSEQHHAIQTFGHELLLTKIGDDKSLDARDASTP